MSSASSAVSSAYASASAKAATSNNPNTGMSTTGIIFTSLTVIITLLALVAGTIYFTGYADDVAEWWAKRYYKAKAIAEVKVLENVGSEKVEGMMKGMLLFPSFPSAQICPKQHLFSPCSNCPKQAYDTDGIGD
jgi:hypothetical protein